MTRSVPHSARLGGRLESRERADPRGGLMSFGPESVPGPVAVRPAGQIDYRLAREAVVREFRRGRLARHDVCDAHPELLRAARNVGQPSGRDCPICEETEAVLVSFAFGARLPPGGRCVTTQAELEKLSQRVSRVSCYVVEVCPLCSWNHLARMFLTGAGLGT